MAVKMTKAQVLKVSKDMVAETEEFKGMLEKFEAIQVGDYDYALPVMVNGVERYAKISITAKDTITNDEGEKVAYDPFIEVDRWDFDKKDKAERAAERERKKAETLKRAEERKAKAKAKAEAKKAKADTESEGE